MKRRIGMALGGGGARGLAHIPLLEVLDEMGLRPSIMAGTSMGAIVAALYASGVSARGMREMVEEFFATRGTPLDRLRNTDWRKALALMDINFGRGGLIKGEKILSFFSGRLGNKRFSDLDIPLFLVATDFWRCEETVLQDGDLAQAVRASMAVPGVFAPVEQDGRVLVDGGLVNPLPYELVMPYCDISVAVDVSSSGRTGKRQYVPGVPETISLSFDTMQKALTSQKMKFARPDVYLAPQMPGIGLLDFHKAKEAFAAGDALKDGFRREMENRL
ncbi:MAG: hypothetical protein A2018_03565 [Alphaproteobacteria bacterium GWF2_58_20]|nr:MAG: hypothetical protein A2018_03565 [Alphaproteobacteria bacterium GWF2_58_20]